MKSTDIKDTETINNKFRFTKRLEGERKLDICYNKLFKMLVDKGMKKV